MASTQEITLEIKKGKTYTNTPVIFGVGDTNEIIKANIVQDGFPYSATKATFNAQKPDGKAIANVTASVSGSVVTLTIPSALTQQSGIIHNAYFLLNGTTSTQRFDIAILPGINLSGNSEDYVPGLENITKMWEQTVNSWEMRITSLQNDIANMDMSDELKKLMDQALEDAKKQYMATFNSAVDELNKTTAEMKVKESEAVGLGKELDKTIVDLNKKINDVNGFLDTLQKQIIATNDAFTKEEQAKVDAAIANMTKKINDSLTANTTTINNAIAKNNSDISTALTKNDADIKKVNDDITASQKNVNDLNTKLTNIQTQVAAIDLPQFKKDVDTANKNAQDALDKANQALNGANSTQINTSMVNDYLVDVDSKILDSGKKQLVPPTAKISLVSGKLVVEIIDINTTLPDKYTIYYSEDGGAWKTFDTKEKTAQIDIKIQKNVYVKLRAICTDTTANSNFSPVYKEGGETENLLISNKNTTYNSNPLIYMNSYKTISSALTANMNEISSSHYNSIASASLKDGFAELTGVNGDNQFLYYKVKIKKYPATFTVFLPVSAPTSWPKNKNSFENGKVTHPAIISLKNNVSSYFNSDNWNGISYKSLGNDMYSIDIPDNSSPIVSDGDFIWIISNYQSTTGNPNAWGVWKSQNSIYYRENDLNIPLLPEVTDSSSKKRLSNQFVKRDELIAYVNKNEVSGVVGSSSSSSGGGSNVDTSSFVTKTDLETNYIKKTDVEANYIKKADIGSYIPANTLTTDVVSAMISQGLYDMLMNKKITAKNGSGADTTITLDQIVAMKTALANYLKTTDLKTEANKAGFSDDWYGSQAQYDALTSRSSTTNYNIWE
ncbi:phage upper tail fiber protein [Companilactobacillus metriopterae]|uniref:phage upper tail fiber protein n=1 Tax=Companilactobacillus metriopterae TaxID=1909267 RepID=UPI00100AEC7F|nr:hypothetical protein [Companilactobacillus metriopterae]